MNVANQQHADHQFRIDRWASGRAVERRQMRTYRAQIDKRVDRTKKLVSTFVV